MIRVMAVLLVTRAAMRRHWRGLLVVTLLVAVAAAAVLTAVAGARRTASALDRFRAYSRSGDIELDVGVASPAQLAAVRRVPTVAGVGVLYQMILTIPNGTSYGETVPSAAAVDESFAHAVDRPLVVAGRLPRQSRADELAVSESFASQHHIGVGGTLTVESWTPAQTQLGATGADPGPPAGPRVTFRIVGLVRRPLDLGVTGGFGGVVVPTRAFYEQYRDRIGTFVGDLLRVRTRRGAADVPATIAAARRIFGDSLIQALGVASETSGASDAIDVLALALWIFAGVAALAGVTAVGIVTLRQLGAEERDQQTLASLGLTARQRAASVALLAVPAAVGGAALAVVIAVLLSPLLPFGVARRAEIDPGLDADGLVLGVGALAVIGFVVLLAAAAAWRIAHAPARDRSRAGVPSPSAAARLAEGARATPAFTTGLRMALEPGRGRSAVPVRSAFAGAALATLGIVAVVVFSASLDRLVTTPRLYGWSWDTVVEPNGPLQTRNRAVCGDVSNRLAPRKVLAEIEAVCLESFEVDGHPLTGWGLHPLRGSIEPTIVEGRAPHNAREIALGADALDATGKSVGDTVRVRGPVAMGRLRIVGQMVFASLASDDPEPLAGGAAMTSAAFARLAGPQDAPNVSILARFAPGVEPDRLPRTAAGLWRFSGAVGRPATLPVEIDRIEQVDDLPLILGGLLALLAGVAVGHAIVVGARRRRHELAVLRTIGFERRDVRAAIAYQSTILTGLGLVVGIPAGFAVGRVVWRLVAEGLGLRAHVEVPVAAVVLVGVVAVVVANGIGALAATAALRDRPAAVLATE